MPVALEPEFAQSVDHWRDLPRDVGSEVAFVGRSNAGKSSAINAIARRKIAFVSKMPGRTQTINFYNCGGNRRLVDLPGYGYAAVPVAAREHWRELISAYLQHRESLRGVVLIMDSRHPLTALDRQLAAWYAPCARPLHVLLTKADKLTRQEAHAAFESTTRELPALCPSGTVQLFSAVTGVGVSAARKLICTWLA